MHFVRRLLIALGYEMLNRILRTLFVRKASQLERRNEEALLIVHVRGCSI